MMLSFASFEGSLESCTPSMTAFWTGLTGATAGCVPAGGCGGGAGSSDGGVSSFGASSWPNAGAIMKKGNHRMRKRLSNLCPHLRIRPPCDVDEKYPPYAEVSIPLPPHRQRAPGKIGGVQRRRRRERRSGLEQEIQGDPDRNGAAAGQPAHKPPVRFSRIVNKHLELCRVGGPGEAVRDHVVFVGDMDLGNRGKAEGDVQLVMPFGRKAFYVLIDVNLALFEQEPFDGRHPLGGYGRRARLRIVEFEYKLVVLPF